MTRHVRVLWMRSYNGNTESDPATTLAKAIYDVVNGKTVISMSCTEKGLFTTVIIIYDD